MSRSVSAPSSVTKTSPCWNGLIVPGSTFRYGSNFWSCTCSPRALSSRPSDAATIPFPSADTTPPVTNTYLGARWLTGFEGSSACGRRGSNFGAGLEEVVQVLERIPCVRASDSRPAGLDRDGDARVRRIDRRQVDLGRDPFGDELERDAASADDVGDEQRSGCARTLEHARPEERAQRLARRVVRWPNDRP